MEEYPRWISYPLDVGNLREVGKNLYVGDSRSVWMKRWRLVVSMRPPTDRPAKTWASKEEPRWKHLKYYMEDGEPVPVNWLPQILDEVRAARTAGPVLIHCLAGVSRSASIAYGVLRCLDGLDHNTALHRVKVPGDYYEKFPVRKTLNSVHAWAENMILRGRTGNS